MTEICRSFSLRSIDWNVGVRSIMFVSWIFQSCVQGVLREGIMHDMCRENQCND